MLRVVFPVLLHFRTIIFKDSHLVNQEVSYPANDDASIQVPSFQLAFPLSLQQAEKVLCVKIQELIESWKQLLHCLQLQLQLLL